MRRFARHFPVGWKPLAAALVVVLVAFAGGLLWPGPRTWLEIDYGGPGRTSFSSGWPPRKLGTLRVWPGGPGLTVLRERPFLLSIHQLHDDVCARQAAAWAREARRRAEAPRVEPWRGGGGAGGQGLPTPGRPVPAPSRLPCPHALRSRSRAGAHRP